MKHKLESNEHFHQKLEKSIPDETNKIFLMTLVKDILPRIYIYTVRQARLPVSCKVEKHVYVKRKKEAKKRHVSQ